MAQRTREVGIRMALGADTVRVVRLLTSSTLRLAMLGGALAWSRRWSWRDCLAASSSAVRPSTRSRSWRSHWFRDSTPLQQRTCQRGVRHGSTR